MTSDQHRTLKVMMPLPGAVPEIGGWLWAMEEVRRGLLDEVKDIDRQTLDWRGPENRDNSIGSLLYHIALIEMSWLFEDILLEPVPADIEELFPYPHRTADGHLFHVEGRLLGEHLECLEASRRGFLERLTSMSLEDWHARRTPPGVDYVVSPAWAVFHLVEHEAGHAFQIRSLLRRVEPNRS